MPNFAELAASIGKNFAANKGLRNAAIGAAGGAATGALASKDGNRLGGAIKGGLLGGAIGGGGSLISPKVIKSFASNASGVKAVENAATSVAPVKAVEQAATKTPVRSFGVASRKMITLPKPSIVRPMPETTKPLPTLASKSGVVTTSSIKQPVPVDNVVAPKSFSTKPLPTLSMKGPTILPVAKQTGYPIMLPKPANATAPNLTPGKPLLRSGNTDVSKFNFEGSPDATRTTIGRNPRTPWMEQPKQGIISKFLSGLTNR